MIETKILGEAVGIQRQAVKDLSETQSGTPLTNAVMIGKFKRGFNRPFKVTKDNYKAILGYDPNHSDFMAVEDVFRSGVSELWVQRIGSPDDPPTSSTSSGSSVRPSYVVLTP